MSRTLVVYHYFEKDDSYRDNFLHFLTFGFSNKVDYIVVVAEKHTIDLPNADNIKYVFTKNLNYDFGGYCHIINENIIDTSKYEYFFFINSSVRGPFLTARDKNHWTEYFIEQLQQDTGIVGSTINTLPSDSKYSISYHEKYGKQDNYSHVQSTSYLLPKKSLLHLIEEGFYKTKESLCKDDVIRDYELRLSQLLKKQGWYLKSLLPEYSAIDYRKIHSDINPTSDQGDILYKDSYFGRTVHPYEIIFIKTNRGIYDLAHLDRLTYSLFASQQPTNRPLTSTDLDDYQSRISLVKDSKRHLSVSPLLDSYSALLRRTMLRIKGKSIRP